MQHERFQSVRTSCLPGEGDGDADGGAEAREPPAALAEGAQAGQRWLDAHPAQQGQRRLLALLESSQQQQQVLLLVDERFAEAFGPQVLPVDPLQPGGGGGGGNERKVLTYLE